MERSFYFYLNPRQHPAPELAAVLRHEQVHVRQWHTLDVLLAQVARAAAWCNPAAWLLRRALLDNLEYLADAAVLATGLDRRAYQYSLLRLSQPASELSLVSHFTFPTLKNRIVMMNSPASSAAQTLRYLLIVPLAIGLTLNFSGAQAQGAGPMVPPQQDQDHVTHYVDGKLISSKAEFLKVGPEDVAFMNVLKDDQARTFSGNANDEYVVIVTTKQHQHRADVMAFNARAAKVSPLVAGTEAPAEINVLTPKALAYITKTYPNSRIIGVTRLVYPSTGQTRYKAELAEGRRPHYAFFDEQGNAVKP